MTKILFAAHDPGGAQMLLPAALHAERWGHHVTMMSSGPATSIWNDKVNTLKSFDSNFSLADLRNAFCLERPDILITGTSFHSDFEHKLWDLAKASDICIVAAIDSWANFKERVTRLHDNDASPHALLVVDKWCLDKIEAEDWYQSHIYITGNPSFDAQASAINMTRNNLPASEIENTEVLFISEPIAEDYADAPPLITDQFGIATMLLTALSCEHEFHVRIKPHPRETFEKWESWREQLTPPLKTNVTIDTRDIVTLASHASLVSGMFSAALIEAAMARVPVLSMQIGRDRIYHPQLEMMPEVYILTLEAQIKPALAALRQAPKRPTVAGQNEDHQNSSDLIISAITSAQELYKPRLTQSEH